MLSKDEEIAVYREEIEVFKIRRKRVLMPTRLKAEYDMMIDRLNVLLKELNNSKDSDITRWMKDPETTKQMIEDMKNEKDNTVLPITDTDISSTACKLPSDVDTDQEATEEIDFPGVIPFQGSPGPGIDPRPGSDNPRP